MKNLSKIIEHGGPALPGTQSASAPQLEARSSGAMGSYGGAGGGFAGAESSRMRGMVYFPQTDTRKEINPTNRKEMLRRARWLYANIGLVKRAINGVARMVVGKGMTPQPFTDDKEWNQLALAAFFRRSNSAKVFDVAEKYNFNRSQLAVLRCSLKDGDMGVAIANSLTNRARFAFYEAHQIGTSRWGTATDDVTGWYDGVYTSSTNAAQRYRILGDQDSYIDLPARDFLHQVDFERPGQRRGVTCLHHAINNLLDITEIQSFLKTGVKQANRVGYYLADKGTPQTSGGMAATVQGNIDKITAASGGQINMEAVYGDGGEIPHVPPGKELRLLNDTRPHPNTLGFMDFIIRDIAWGLNMSPELLWNIAKLGGANTRFALADAQGFIDERQQLLVDQYCGPVWNVTIAKEMKYGDLRPCRDPNWMFKIGWIPPARVTVDFGRDGKLHLEQMRSMMLTFKKFYGWNGDDWKPQIEEWIDERAYIIKYAKEKHNLSMDDLMGTLPKQPTPEITTAESTDPADADE